MLRKVFLVAAVLSLLVLATNPWPGNGVGAAPPEPPEPSQSAQATAATNLLANGNMDDLNIPFYWRPPNHFVAGMWYEWFWTGAIPEFLDGGIKYHNACYPPPPPGKICVDDMHNSSQGYIRWGAAYIAGIYQSVSAFPCALYQFEAYNFNDFAQAHPKVGIDPIGEVLPPYIPPDGDTLPLNCPPTGHSKCPNPGIESLSELPPRMVWSPELEHAGWAAISVTTEALSTTISVWTYVAPDPVGAPARSTYWDYASLVQVSPQTLSPDGRFPAPDGKISGLTVTPSATTAQIRWTTGQPAFSQVFYRLHPPAPSCTGTACIICPPGTTCSIHTAYLPLIARGPGSVNDFTFKTVPTTVPTTNPTVSLTGLEAGKAYDFVVMSRAFTSGACVSSVSSTGTFTTTP
jgi:hypothetical protein